MRLNLGSGTDYREGWINSDFGSKDYISNEIKVDVLCDLNAYPYPFETNQFDYILMNHVLTYVVRMDLFASEINRILEVNGEVKIVVPHFSYWGGYAEPNVVNRFCLNATPIFRLFENNGFEIVSKQFVTSNHFFNSIFRLINLSNFVQRMYERFFAFIFPAQDIVWILKKLSTEK